VLDIKLEKQLRVITPDEPGIFGRVLGTLANAHVNLRALCVHSKQKEGIFLLLTSNPEKAETALKSLGYRVEIETVVAAIVEDRIGSGAEIGALLGNAIIDVAYCYGSTPGNGKALVVFQTSDNIKAVETLR